MTAKKFGKSPLLISLILVVVLGMISMNSSVYAASKPSQVKSLSVKSVTTSSCTISWKKVRGTSGYQVFMKKGSSGSYKLIKTTKGTSFKNTNLSSNTRYTYKIRAYKISRGKRIYGKYSSSKTIITKKPICKHQYSEAGIIQNPSCEKDGEMLLVCRLCGSKSYNRIPALGHEWEEASCEIAETCKICGLTRDSALGHIWNDATCTAPSTCERCNKTKGVALGHNLKDGYCTRCDYFDEYTINMKKYNEYAKKCDEEIAKIKAEGPLYTGTDAEFNSEISSLNSQIKTLERKIVALMADSSNSALAKRRRYEAEKASLEKQRDELYAQKNRASSVALLESQKRAYYKQLFG